MSRKIYARFYRDVNRSVCTTAEGGQQGKREEIQEWEEGGRVL